MSIKARARVLGVLGVVMLVLDSTFILAPGLRMVWAGDALGWWSFGAGLLIAAAAILTIFVAQKLARLGTVKSDH